MCESFTLHDIVPSYDNIIEPFGLINMSSHCWANSLVQALYSLPPLVSIVKKSEYTLNSIKPSLLAELIKLINSHGSLSVSNLTRTLISYPHAPQFNSDGAQSVDEAFTYLLDNCPEIAPLFVMQFRRFGMCSVKEHQNGAKPFADNHSFDIKVPHYMSFATIESLNNFVLLSIAKFDYPDACCDKYYDYSYLTKFSKIIVLIRTGHGNSNFTAPNTFSVPINNGGRASFTLAAIVMYTGGHYYTIGRRGNKLYNFNDSSVSEINTFVIDDYAHMMFYSYDRIIPS